MASFPPTTLPEWRLALDPRAFLALFRAWNRGPFEGALDLLDRLRPHYTLACLSNTNAVHWEDILDGHGLRPCFDRHYASHLLGMAKPDPEVYGFVAEDLGRAAAEIVFFDDSLENVAGAQDLGMKAYRVEGLAELSRRLDALGLLDP